MATGSDKGDVILAIDQGTTSTKALLMDSDLGVLAEASREFGQHFPRPGWVEHDVEEIIASVEGAVEDALRVGSVRPNRIAAIGVTNQRETTAVWDRGSGRPMHRAIVWQDRRTADFCSSLKERGVEPLLSERTGLVIDPYFSATKISWLLENVPEVREAAQRGSACFGTMDSYLAWRLTGGEAHVTDVSNASRTLLMRLEASAWDDEILELFRIPREALPRIVSNNEVVGHTRSAGCLPDGVPIAALCGDQQAALFGQACFDPGDTKCTYGTGAFVVRNTGSEIVRSRNGLLSTTAWKLGEETTYALEGSCFTAGAIVQWLRDGLGIIEASDEVEALSRSVPSSEGVVVVPALTGLGAPHWDPGARGLICGITRGTTRAHIARAALEGIAFQVADVLRAMEEDTGRRAQAIRVDGGATRNNLLLEFQADVLGQEVVRPKITSTTALGAALEAGLTVGLFPSVDSIRKKWEEERRFRPSMDDPARAAATDRWRAAVRRTTGGEDRSV